MYPYDYLTHKPNIGTNKYLLSHPDIYKAYTSYYDYKSHAKLLSLLKYEIKNAIGTIQIVRNEASHGGNISKAECQQVRDLIIGIGEESIMGALLKTRN